MKINEKLATIQTKFKSKKSRFNSFGKYKFRSAEDILEATKPFLLELGVTIIIDEHLEEIAGLLVLHSTAIISDGEEQLQATAVVGIDLNQKGMNVPQQFGSASSYGKKYALGNLFLIDDTADSDATNNHGKETQAVKKPVLSGDALTKAKAAIKSGKFSIADVQSKYEVTPDILKTLK